LVAKEEELSAKRARLLREDSKDGEDGDVSVDKFGDISFESCRTHAPIRQGR